jgi:hypothetical protein
VAKYVYRVRAKLFTPTNGGGDVEPEQTYLVVGSTQTLAEVAWTQAVVTSPKAVKEFEITLLGEVAAEA